MKTKTYWKFCLSLAILSLCQMPAIADDSNQQQPSVGKRIVVNLQNQPRTLFPVCYYLDGCVTIECGFCSVEGTVTRLSDNTQWSGSSDDGVLSIEISDVPGIYELTFTLSDGNSYIGVFTL